MREHDLAEFVEISGLAIRRQAHHLVFVAKFPEAEILGDRRVVHAQGMREGHGAVDLHAIALAGGPHGAGEIAQAVGGKQRRLLERRDKKRAAQMRLVVLDAMELRAKRLRIDVKGLRQSLGDAHELLQHLGAFPREARHAQRVKQLRAQARPGIARHGHVIDVRERDARFLKAVADRRHGKSRGVLHAIEALFFDRGDQAGRRTPAPPRHCRDKR